MKTVKTNIENLNHVVDDRKIPQSAVSWDLGERVEERERKENGGFIPSSCRQTRRSPWSRFRPRRPPL